MAVKWWGPSPVVGLSRNRHGSATRPTSLVPSVRIVIRTVRLRLAIAFALGLACSAWGAENPLATARDTVAQWVQTQQLVSKTQAEWEADREMLNQSKALFERELKAVQEELGKQSANSSVADAERVKTEAELKHANEALERTRVIIAGLEQQLRELLALLPVPVVSSAPQLVNRLPEDPNNTKAGITERVQTVVSLLNEVDKFNNAVSVFTEKRPNHQGEEVSVETIYVGLGAAYFVNEAGDFAGQGRPGPQGWEWTIDPKLASAVREVIRIYRNERTARFVSLPVAIQ